MPFLLSQNKKILVSVVTLSLMVFSGFMLAFDQNNDASLNAKASVISAQEGGSH
jgi:hypothetical protein